MKIIADENIPFANDLFSSLGDVILIPGRHMSAKDMDGASVLLTRSVTKINEALLGVSDIRFVGTCTIGTDHIDIPYLRSRGIHFSSAPGCNANGVVQYDICALAYLGKLDSSLKYAVLGCGNVGRRVYRTLKALGFDCIGIDPHLTQEDIPDLSPFESIFECDVICMHTPLVKTGLYPTESLIGAAELEQLKPGCVLLNAGRGECIDNSALLEFVKQGNDISLALDVWTSEPNIDPALHRYVKIGTPHIAGYSFEGRVNGTTMIFEALSRHLGKDETWIASQLSELKEKILGPRQAVRANSIQELVLNTYDIAADHAKLGEVLDKLPDAFDNLRKNYFKRREFSHYQCDSRLLNEDGSISLSDAVGMGKYP